MIVENDHVWRLTIGLHSSGCDRCGVKYDVYLAAKRLSELEPDNQELKDRLRCLSPRSSVKAEL